jgi:hypothetical protein
MEDAFQQVQQSIQMLKSHRSTMTENLQPFAADGTAQLRQMADQMSAWLFASIDGLRGNIQQIDKLSLAAARYSFSDRIHLLPLLLSVGIWALVGITLPLFLLILPEAAVTRLIAGAILISVLVFSFAAVGQFVLDLREKPFDLQGYLIGRWYRPINETLKQQIELLSRGGIVSTELAYEALNSDDSSRFNISLRDLLREYLKAAAANNDTALQFNTDVVQAMRADPEIGKLAKDYRNPRGGPVLYPFYFLEDDQRFNELVGNWEKTLPNSENDISVETEDPGWSRVELKIPGSEFYRDPSTARRTLEQLRASLRDSESARLYFGERQKLSGIIADLRSTLGELGIK